MLYEVITRAVACELGVDLRAARAGVVEFLEDEYRPGLAHDEAFAVLLEGTARALGLFVLV